MVPINAKLYNNSCTLLHIQAKVDSNYLLWGTSGSIQAKLDTNLWTTVPIQAKSDSSSCTALPIKAKWDCNSYFIAHQVILDGNLCSTRIPTHMLGCLSKTNWIATHILMGLSKSNLIALLNYGAHQVKLDSNLSLRSISRPIGWHLMYYGANPGHSG
jgi:hypothetical protein